MSLKLVVHDWVTKILIPKQLQDGILNELPNPYNRAYFPTKKDLRNVAHRAIVKRRNSLFDQDSLNKILKKQAKCSGLHYSLQQYSQSGLKTNTSNDWLGKYNMYLWLLRSIYLYVCLFVVLYVAVCVVCVCACPPLWQGSVALSNCFVVINNQSFICPF